MNDEGKYTDLANAISKVSLSTIVAVVLAGVLWNQHTRESREADHRMVLEERRATMLHEHYQEVERLINEQIKSDQQIADGFQRLFTALMAEK